MSASRRSLPVRRVQWVAVGLALAVLSGCARPTTVASPTSRASSTPVAVPATLDRATRVSPPATTAPGGPSGNPAFTAIRLSPADLPLYEKLEIAFDLRGVVAANLDFPYDPAPPPGLAARAGITVDGLFLPPGETDWARAIIQPAFRYQAYQRYDTGAGTEALYPVDHSDWRVRFAPTRAGTWQVKLRFQDSGVCAHDEVPCTHWIESSPTSFVAGAPRPGAHGFIRVSAADPRYFEYSDGTPFYVNGFQAGLGTRTDVDGDFAAYAAGGVTLLRSWMSATSVFSRGMPQWAAWANAELDWIDPVPGHDVSARLDAGSATACIFQGFGESARPVFFGGRLYSLTIRARLDGVKRALDPAQPFGLTVRLGGWPKEVCAQADPTARSLSPHWIGDGGWETYMTTFELPEDVALDGSTYLTLALENAAAGAAYIDSVYIGESPDGPNVLPHGDLNDHLGFDQAASWRWDQILDSAAAHGLALKLVVLEKQDSILGYIRPDGSVALERDDANFYGWPDQSTKVRRLQEYYWRYLSARWGYATALHSWELLNEGDPFNGNHYDLANRFAESVHTLDPNRHLVTTSFWHSFPVRDFWANPVYGEVDYADFHAYVDTTWLEPGDFADPTLMLRCGLDRACYQAALTADSALYHLAHSAVVAASGVNKPVIRGEGGLTLVGSAQEPDPDLMRDVNGVWLHKLVLAQLDAGGLGELYWFTDEIRANGLLPVFGRYIDFLSGARLNSGDWRAATAPITGDPIRVVGQVETGKDRGLLWIDNPTHTWKGVVTGDDGRAATAQVRVAGFTPGASLVVSWWDLCSGQPPDCTIGETRRETLSADASGALTLDVRGLATDVGVRIGDWATSP